MIAYEKLEIPPGYKCSRCQAHGVKLWRQYNVFADAVELLCHRCAAPGVAVDADGRTTSDLGVGETDQIGDSLVPAVPTPDTRSYWGYTSVPLAACAWWRALPNQPGDARRPFYVSPEEAAAEKRMLDERAAHEQRSLTNRARWRRDTVFLVEATDYEQHVLWDFWAKDSRRAQAKPTLEWKQLGGELATVGTYHKRPICVSVQWVSVSGQVVLFYHPTSTLVDWDVINEWLDTEYKHVPTWDSGRRPKCDAQNFHHCRDAVSEANQRVRAKASAS